MTTKNQNICVCESQEMIRRVHEKRNWLDDFFGDIRSHFKVLRHRACSNENGTTKATGWHWLCQCRYRIGS